MPTHTDDDLDRSRGDLAAATTEETPLLGSAGTNAIEEAPEDPRSLYRQNVIILVFAIFFLLDLGASIAVPPLNEIMEGVLCRQYYPGLYPLLKPDDPDSVCKSHDVQKTLAMLRGWGATFDCLAGMLVAIPFGVLSDKWGRRPIMTLSLLGFTCQILATAAILAFPDVFPIWTVWPTSLFLLIGGGASIAVAMVYTYIADVTPVANQASLYFQALAVSRGSELIASPVAAALMTRSPWLAFCVGAVLIIIGTSVSLVLPETNDLHNHARDMARQRDTTDGDYNNYGSDNGNGSSKLRGAHKVLQHLRSSVLETWDFVLANQRVAFLIITLVFILLGRWVQEMLLQYATRRFHWTWSKATFLLTVGNASNLVVLVALLPAISWVLVSRFRMSGPAKDLILARISSVLLIMGSLVIAFAVNGYILALGLVVLSSGSGLSSLIRSLANAMIEEHHVGILNTLIGLVDQVALMIAGPLLSTTLGIGFDLGGPWVGLPFICSALMFSVATVVTMTFRFPTPRDPDEEEESMAGSDPLRSSG